MGEIRVRRVCASLASTALAATLLVSTTVPASAAPPKCDGQAATITGSNTSETIVGTDGADVIVALGGNDIIRGRGGADIICGDAGNDRIYGQAGKDRLFGKTDGDELYGGGGADLLAGQAGDDRLDGGPGTDTCYQAGGSGPVVSCELPSTAPTPTPGRILAIAYTNLDSVPGFDPAIDALIAKLIDTDGYGPGAGDQIVMGGYPTKLDPGSGDFAPWRETLHTATSIVATPEGVTAYTANGYRQWYAPAETESYLETDASGTMTGLVQDNYPSDRWTDTILINPSTPSRPGRELFVDAHDPGDDILIDVDVFP